jgi:hypothetical protein
MVLAMVSVMKIRSSRSGLLLPRTFALACAAVVMLGAVVVGCSTPTSYDQSAPAIPSNAEATTQVTRLFEGVLKKDGADLTKFLAPNFVLQRANGDGISRDAFIAELPDLSSYKLGAITGSAYGDTLTATYSASTELIVDGRKFPSTPNPFLSTFVRADGEWHLVSHGNFAGPE